MGLIKQNVAYFFYETWQHSQWRLCNRIKSTLVAAIALRPLVVAALAGSVAFSVEFDGSTVDAWTVDAWTVVGSTVVGSAFGGTIGGGFVSPHLFAKQNFPLQQFLPASWSHSWPEERRNEIRNWRLEILGTYHVADRYLDSKLWVPLS